LAILAAADPLSIFANFANFRVRFSALFSLRQRLEPLIAHGKSAFAAIAAAIYFTATAALVLAKS